MESNGDEALNKLQNILKLLYDKAIKDDMNLEGLRYFLKSVSKESDFYKNHLSNHFRFVNNYHCTILSSDVGPDYSDLIKIFSETDMERTCPICTKKGGKREWGPKDKINVALHYMGKSHWGNLRSRTKDDQDKTKSKLPIINNILETLNKMVQSKDGK